MASNRTKFSVGIFVIMGMTVIGFAVMYFGLYGIIEKGRYWVAYFDESVQGLDKDSTVKYRGVTVGRVDSLGVAEDNKLIEVVIKIDTDLNLDGDVVAQLKSVGITGIMFVELDIKKAGEQDFSPKLSFTPAYHVVATKPSEMKNIMDSVERILNQLDSLDVKGISDRAIYTLENVNTAIDNLETKKISANIQTTFARLDRILAPEKWDALVGDFKTSANSMDTMIQNIDGAVSNLNRAISRVDGIISDNEAQLSVAIGNVTRSLNDASQFLSHGTDLINNTDKTIRNLHRYLTDTLQNLEQASRYLNQSMEQIADQPSTLIFSNPPEEIKK